MSNKSHSQATNAYGSVKADISGRALEVEVLNTSANRMNLVAVAIEKGEKVRSQDIGDIFNANQKIWQVFLDNMLDDESGIPQEIRDNIGSLAVFTFKHTLEILAKPTPDKIRTLVDINRSIAKGLATKPAQPAAGEAPAQAKAPTPQQQPAVKKPLETSGEQQSGGLNIDL